ncbi:MAG: hypothetical protein SGI92_02470 [Bryobacteraceae bacterium]|nr:hypothetical protein [Bryobacteraceae bacterium]
MNPRLFLSAGGLEGKWLVERMTSVKGEPLARVPRLSIAGGTSPPNALCVLKGVIQ